MIPANQRSGHFRG